MAWSDQDPVEVAVDSSDGRPRQRTEPSLLEMSDRSEVSPMEAVLDGTMHEVGCTACYVVDAN